MKNYYLYYQKMYSNRYNIDVFVIKVEQKSSEGKILVRDASDPNVFYPYSTSDYSVTM